MKQKFFFKVASVIGMAVFFIFLSGVGLCETESKLPKIITIASYPTGSLASMFVIAHGKVIKDLTGIRARAYPADTGIARLGPARAGDAALTIVGSDAYFAINGLHEFAAKKWGPQKLRTVWGSSQIMSGMIVRGDSGIKSIADVKGKRVVACTGSPKVTKSVEAILAFGGLTWDDVIRTECPGYVGCIKALLDGSVDVSWAGHASSVLKELEASIHGLRWIPLPHDNKEGWARFHKISPQFIQGILSPGWPGVGKKPIQLAASPYYYMAYPIIDANLIYTIVKALDEGYKDSKGAAPLIGELNFKRTLTPSLMHPAPYHEGVIRYAKEKGKWTPELEKFQQGALKAEEERIKAWKAKISKK